MQVIDRRVSTLINYIAINCFKSLIPAPQLKLVKSFQIKLLQLSHISFPFLCMPISNLTSDVQSITALTASPNAC